jgi:hypothetical protein
MSTRKSLLCRIALITLVLALGGQACTISLIQFPTLFPANPTTQPGVVMPAGPSPTPQSMAQTTFVAILPEQLAAGETLFLTVLDEVTGLSINATNYQMQPRDAQTYTATLPLPLNAVIKYRYMRRGSTQNLEDTALNAPIRYRLYSVLAQGEIQDILADWVDKSYSRATGNIQGRVLNADTNTPIPNIMVEAGGVQYITDSGGRFSIQGLPVGTHNLVAYALDGSYQPFQQGAAVAQGLNTNVEVRVKPAPIVDITFTVSVPSNTVPGAPVRLAGNLLQLGNTFADLQGGTNTSPERMPILALTPDGRYTTTISLPVGAYIQYKYTLGDGFWNAEHKSTGGFALREFVVPAQATTFTDTVATWQSGPSAPILFEATVPSVTPAGDIVYVQFNPYGWTEPIPMWPMGNNKWAYKLYGPFNLLDSFGYRYCRNGQCGSADDTATAGDAAPGHVVSTSITAQDIQDTIASWKWYENPEATTLVGSVITPRPAGFVTGVEFQSTFRPSWSYFMPQALTNIQAIGANQVIFTPGWTYTSINPLTFSPITGRDPMWIDTAIMVSQARALGLNVAILPTPHFPASTSDASISPDTNFWSAAPRTPEWWQAWFDQYRAFAINYADLATQSGAQTVILGGDWIGPALPSGTLSNGISSGVPADADARWKAIIAEVRQHFNGKVLWALPYTSSKLQTSLEFFKDTDGIYLLWSAALTNQANASKSDIANEAGRLLDNEVSPLQALTSKPIYIAIAFPSATGAATGCLSDGKGGCLDWNMLSRPNADIDSVSLNLQAQADIYEAILIAVNTRAWVSGVISRGYYPPVALQDKSTSVHSKPAAEILWYWFPRLTGTIK